MKQFESRQLLEAYAHAAEGGQALHLHTFNQMGHDLFKRYPVIAHLFDQNKERLIKTAKSLGVRVIKVEREGTSRQHIDLCGRPLEKAKALCEPVPTSLSNQMNQIFTAGYSGHTPAQLKQAADTLGALVVDIRHKPVSRIPGWGLTELHHVFNGGVKQGYCHLAALGNTVAGTGQGILLADPIYGIETLLVWAAKQPLILLCGCANFAECHRCRVSELLAKHSVHTQELQWPELETGELKAISLWQPWATLIGVEAKSIETRGWATSYRGELVIHAAKNTTELAMCAHPFFWQAFETAGLWTIPEAISENFTDHSIQMAYRALTNPQRLQWLPLPLGALVCTVDLVDCIPTEELLPTLTPQERTFGDYSPGRFGWVLENVRRIEPTIPFRGAQGFFNVDRAVWGGVAA